MTEIELVLPEGMFMFSQNGNLSHNIYKADNSGILWYNHVQIGRVDQGQVTSTEQAVPDMFYFYRYDFEMTSHNIHGIKCVYYRKVYIDNVETIFPGKFPLKNEIMVGTGRYDQINHPPLYEEAVDNLWKLQILFMLSLWNLNNTIKLANADNVNGLYQRVVNLYLLHLDTVILTCPVTLTQDMVTRMMLTADYTGLEKYAPPQWNEYILRQILVHAEQILPTLPLSLYIKLIKNPQFRKYRTKISLRAHYLNRLDLAHYSCPSPLRKCNVV